MNKKKGFTLAELLIVVAIIAVLVGVAIPVFTAQLEKSREAVDLANIRSAYADCTTAVLTETDTDGATYTAGTAGTPASASKSVTLSQKDTTKWEGDNKDVVIGGNAMNTISINGKTKVKVTVSSNGTVSIAGE